MCNLPILLLAREIAFNAFGPFKDVDGTAVKLFRAIFNSYIVGTAKEMRINCLCKIPRTNR